MTDDIVTRLRDSSGMKIVSCSSDGFMSSIPDTELMLEAADEIERLRALCNDLHHDATCYQSFCRLCGEGIREWEARRG